MQKKGLILGKRLQKQYPNGPQRVPFIEYDAKDYVENNIYRRIIGRDYLQKLKQWLPGGYIWEKKVYCCYPFEIVVFDFSLGIFAIEKLIQEVDCPMIIHQARWNLSTSFMRGYWINTLKNKSISVDQIDLYAEIFGFRRERAVHELKHLLKIDFSEKVQAFFEKPHGEYPIMAIYEDKGVPDNIKRLGLKIDSSYCFRNSNGSVRGWAHKVSSDSGDYFVCITPWRNKKDSLKWSWLPFGFQKPYPFYGVENLDKYPEARVVLTEDFDIKRVWEKENGEGPWIFLSWLGGEKATSDLDWQSLVGRQIDYLAVGDDEGKKVGLSICKAAKKAGVKVYCCIWPELQTKSGQCPESPEQFKKNAKPAPGVSLSQKKILDYKFYIADCFDEDVGESLESISEEGQRTVEPMSRWLGELLKEDIKVAPFLLEPFFRTDELVIIAAPKKTAKSFLALDLAMALASGEGFGGRFSASKAEIVTYVDAEMGEGMLQERAKNIKRLYKHGDLLDEKLMTLSLSGMKGKLNLLQEKDRAWLESKMAPKTKLLVLDNLGKLIPPQKEFAEREWRSVEEWIRGLNRRGVAVFLVTHMTKNGSVVRGTGKILDDANTVVTLKRPEKWIQADGNKVEFHFYGRDLSDEQLEPFGVQYTTRLGRFFRYVRKLGEAFEGNCFVSDDEVKRFGLKGLKLDMVELARSKGEVRAGDFKTESGRPSPSTVTKYLKELCADEVKLLRKKGEGNETRYCPIED